MAAPIVFPCPVIVQDVLSPQILNVPAGAVSDAGVNANAAIAASKQEHQYEHIKADPFATTTAVQRIVMHVVYGLTGTLIQFGCGVTTAAIGAATVTVDLYKNGSSILTSAITIDNTLATDTIRTATFTSAALAAGDVLELNITAAAAGGGTLPKGFFARLVMRELAQ
jgi:hypothetical protein